MVIILGFLVFLVIWEVIMGFICYKIAEKNGRHARLAFALGFLFGIFGVIGYAIAGETEVQKVERLDRILNKRHQ